MGRKRHERGPVPGAFGRKGGGNHREVRDFGRSHQVVAVPQRRVEGQQGPDRVGDLLVRCNHFADMEGLAYVSRERVVDAIWAMGLSADTVDDDAIRQIIHGWY